MPRVKPTIPLCERPKPLQQPTIQAASVFSFGNISDRPIRVAGRSKAWTVFVRSNTGIVGSNPTRGMHVCMHLYCVCDVPCVGSGLETSWSPVRCVLRNVYRNTKLRKRPGPKGGLYSHWLMNEFMAEFAMRQRQPINCNFIYDNTRKYVTTLKVLPLWVTQCLTSILLLKRKEKGVWESINIARRCDTHNLASKLFPRRPAAYNDFPCVSQVQNMKP
jgi:hypothetical protein